jgi:hypothetical protein
MGIIVSPSKRQDQHRIANKNGNTRPLMQRRSATVELPYNTGISNDDKAALSIIRYSTVVK